MGIEFKDLLKSNTAKKRGIDNRPNQEAKDNLLVLLEKVLIPIQNDRRKFVITSGFRCKELNRIVGGSATSQHIKGEAADLYFENQLNGDTELLLDIADLLGEWDQLICYHDKNILHISYRAGENRKQCLLSVAGNGFQKVRR